MDFDGFLGISRDFKGIFWDFKGCKVILGNLRYFKGVSRILKDF